MKLNQFQAAMFRKLTMMARARDAGAFDCVRAKNFNLSANLSWNLNKRSALCACRFQEVSAMRGVFVVAFVCLVSQPCLAQSVSQNFLKKEPHFLAPYSSVFIDNGSCRGGQVLKVTGALGAMRRKKICVPLGREEASRTFAIP